MSVDPEFESFFRESYPVARGLAERIVGSVPDAEDVAAEAFAKALVRWSHVGNLAYREAWVLRVTTSGAIDVVRYRRRRQMRTPGGGQTGVADEETRLVVVAAMSRLPKRQREAIALRDLADLSPPAVAASLGISVNSVKRHLQRGLATLRNDLSDEED